MARPSHVRDAVAELVASSGRHDWSGDEVAAELTARGVSADASSVFRALARLEAEGLVWRVDLGDGRARYEAAGEHHEHVRCEVCGAVSGVPGCVLDGIAPAIERSTGFQVTGHRVVFSGLCAHCSPGGEA